jgi:hypothetical protein
VPIKMQLTGLRELLAALRKVAPDAKRELSASLKTIGKMVQADTQADMPRRRGKARRSVKVKVVARRGFEGVQISEGGAVAPYAPWLDFGGTVGRGRRSTARVTFHGGGRVTVQRGGSRGSGSVVRPFIKDGRYLYPAYYRRYDDMVAATLEAVRRACTAAGLEVTSR